MMVVWEKKILNEKDIEVPIKFGEHFPLTKKEVEVLKKMLNKIVNWKISK